MEGETATIFEAGPFKFTASCQAISYENSYYSDSSYDLSDDYPHSSSSSSSYHSYSSSRNQSQLPHSRYLFSSSRHPSSRYDPHACCSPCYSPCGGDSSRGVNSTWGGGPCGSNYSMGYSYDYSHEYSYDYSDEHTGYPIYNSTSTYDDDSFYSDYNSSWTNYFVSGAPMGFTLTLS